MSKSLIRKNQLHPDIADLISGYGNGFFITQEELNIAISQAITDLQQGSFTLSNVVYTTGNQNINGIKTFTSRPTVNGANILIQGDIVEGGSIQNAVYTTGNQTINGIKNFTSRPTFGGIGLATLNEIGGGSTAFDGNRSITRTTINGVTPGGNDVVTFLNNLFYPFTQAVINLNSFNTVYELGTTLSTVNCVGSITLNSLNINQITNLQAFVGNNGVPQIVPQPSTSFSFNGEVNLTNSANITARANSRDQNNQVVQITSISRTINFAAPWYYGSGAANLTPAQIQSLFTGPLKKVELPSNKTITVTANNQKIYFAYPQDWGVLTSIKDQNNFENLNGWLNRPNLSFTLANGSSHTYTVRETSLFNTYTEPFSYTFIF